MQLKSSILIGAFAAGVFAAPGAPGAPPAPPAPGPALLAPAPPVPAPGVPGFPLGNGLCLSDSQAAFVVSQFKSILTNIDRKAAAMTANALLDAKYSETSDSIDVLDGSPQGSVSFNSKQAFISGVTGAPAIPSMTDLDIIHDCTKVVWQWLADGIGMDISPIKGFNKLTADPRTGIVKSNELGFNSIAWGRDIGWTCTPPLQGAQ